MKWKKYVLNWCREYYYVLYDMNRMGYNNIPVTMTILLNVKAVRDARTESCAFPPLHLEMLLIVVCVDTVPSKREGGKSLLILRMTE